MPSCSSEMPPSRIRHEIADFPSQLHQVQLHQVPFFFLHPSKPPHKSKSKRSTQKDSTRILTVTPLYKDLVWSVDNFFSASECAAWIAYGEENGFTETRMAATEDNAFRENGRIQIWRDDIAARLWERMAQLVPNTICSGRASGCFANIRLYRYVEGQRFGKHIDESVDTGDGQVTGVTVLIYLNGDDITGGETVFYDGRRDERVAVSFKPKQGTLLFHGHGSRCLTHEAQVIKSGAKYVLRTDVIYTQMT